MELSKQAKDGKYFLTKKGINKQLPIGNLMFRKKQLNEKGNM